MTAKPIPVSEDMFTAASVKEIRRGSRVRTSDGETGAVEAVRKMAFVTLDGGGSAGSGRLCAMFPPHETSYSKLSDHDWRVLSSRWARGVDWCVTKLGRRWTALPSFGNAPLFKTKTEAFRYISDLVCAESRHRSWIAAKEKDEAP